MNLFTLIMTHFGPSFNPSSCLLYVVVMKIIGAIELCVVQVVYPHHLYKKCQWFQNTASLALCSSEMNGNTLEQQQRSIYTFVMIRERCPHKIVLLTTCVFWLVLVISHLFVCNGYIKTGFAQEFVWRRKSPLYCASVNWTSSSGHHINAQLSKYQMQTANSWIYLVLKRTFSYLYLKSYLLRIIIVACFCRC